MSGSKNTPFVERLLNHKTLAPLIVHHRRIEGSPPLHREPRVPLSEPIAAALRTQGAPRLYHHQAEGVDRLREGRDVLLVTPTASGKTLLFSERFA